MLKTLLALSCLSLSFGANAAIVSLDSSFGADTITRDTDTGLDWLDVTVTRGLSYNQVDAQLGSGGDYDGYRYATMAELDQLITNFGYIDMGTICRIPAQHCDTGIPGDNIIIENMIKTLGDTGDAWLDETNSLGDVSPTGAGFTEGILGTQYRNAGRYDIARILDREEVFRGTGDAAHDIPDEVNSMASSAPLLSYETTGSFLVAPSPVPIPAAAWLFGSALLGLAGIKRRQS